MRACLSVHADEGTQREWVALLHGCQLSIDIGSTAESWEKKMINKLNEINTCLRLNMHRLLANNISHHVRI